MIALSGGCDKPGPSVDILADYETVPSARPVGARIASAQASAATLPATSSVPVASHAAGPGAASSGPPAAAGTSPTPGSASPVGSAAAPVAKVYECGSKGKPDCPMQRWMKGVAGGAVASGDAAKIARAFETMGGRAPSGMKAWAAIAAAGAAKARADDIDGAKQECKRCHDANTRSYRASQRDAKWP